jgi:hypothetical protein
MLGAGAYRRHIENRIRGGNTPPPSMAAVTSRARTPSRGIRIRWFPVAALLVFLGGMAAFGAQLPAPPSATPTPHRRGGGLGKAGGAVPAGTTVFDDAVPAVAKLDSDLLAALRQASTDAGIRFVVNGGWRSPAYEDKLRRDAIAKYGSEAEAARWVATGETSAHVSGDAVDLGPAAATAWLSAHGAAYGLCQIYANEPWHSELRDHGCPPMYADPTQDPRMQR